VPKLGVYGNHDEEPYMEWAGISDLLGHCPPADVNDDPEDVAHVAHTRSPAAAWSGWATRR